MNKITGGFMKTTRRSFFKTLGLGIAASATAGTMLPRFKAEAQTLEASATKIFDNGIIQLNQNESGRGPGPNTLKAIRDHATKRIGRGYPSDYVNELHETIANEFDLDKGNVLLASGSTPLLDGSVKAFCSRTQPLVTAVPSFSTSASMARKIGAPVREVVLDDSMTIDLEGMAAQAPGAGMVYLCNPNNPSGTIHGPAAIEKFVRQVMQTSPGTIIHIDEAYIDYADPGAMETALPLVNEFKNVFITRSFSKAHAMAGLRIGYALGHADTISAIDNSWGMGDVTMLGAVGALTSFKDKAHIEWERKENAEIKALVTKTFEDMGFEVPKSHTNHLFVNLKRPAGEFREACLSEKIAVGRDFPPMENSHCRISLGSREEMTKAIEVFKKILS